MGSESFYGFGVRTAGDSRFRLCEVSELRIGKSAGDGNLTLPYDGPDAVCKRGRKNPATRESEGSVGATLTGLEE